MCRHRNSVHCYCVTEKKIGLSNIDFILVISKVFGAKLCLEITPGKSFGHHSGAGDILQWDSHMQGNIFNDTCTTSLTPRFCYIDLQMNFVTVAVFYVF